MGDQKEHPQRKRIRFAEKVVPDRVRMFFAEEKTRKTYFLLGLLISSITAKYLLKILITFLTLAWGLKLLDAVLIRNLNEGLTSILEFYMLLLADLKLGYFWLLFFATIAYCAGLRLLSHSYPHLTRREIDPCTNNNLCPSNHPKFLFYFALVLITIGKSSTTICLKEFKPSNAKDVTPSHLKPPDAKDVTPSHSKEKKFIRFGWLMLVVAGSLLGAFALPFAPIGWNIELQLCAYMMGASFVMYWLGTLFYSPDHAEGSPISSVYRVIILAIQNRHVSYDEVEKLVQKKSPGNPMDNNEGAGRPKNDGASQIKSDSHVPSLSKGRLRSISDLYLEKQIYSSFIAGDKCTLFLGTD